MEYKIAQGLDPALTEKWNSFVAGQKTGSLYQMAFWKNVYGKKKPGFFFWGEEGNEIRIAALIQGSRIPFLGLDCFIDRGPVCDSRSGLLKGLEALLNLLGAENTIRLRVNPYWEFPDGEALENGLDQLGFVPYQRLGDSHFETLTIDLTKPTNELFKNLRKDTRWRIKQSEKMGVTVYQGQEEKDVKDFYELLKTMSRKKKMTISNYSFFLTLWEQVLKEHRLGTLVMASYNGRLLSGIILLRHGERAVYAWGASESESLDRISKNHLVLWKGILWSKEAGCSVFDMGGFAGTLNKNPQLESIDAYKKGFGGQYCRLVRIHKYVFKKETEKWIRFFFPKK